MYFVLSNPAWAGITCCGFTICMMSLRSSFFACPETWTSLNILGLAFFNLLSIFANCALFVSAGMTEEENTILSSLFSLNGS